MNVLMIGVDKTSVGGMLTVVENYLNNEQFCKKTNLKYIATVIRAGKWKKIKTLISKIPEIWTTIRRDKIEIVHVHMAERGSVFREGFVIWLAKLNGCKTVIHMHGATIEEWYNHRNFFVKGIVKKIFCMADMMIVLGRNWLPFMLSVMGEENKEKIVVLHNAVRVPDVNKYNSKAKDILFYGMLIQRKGIDDLLTAFNNIIPQIPNNICLVLYGDDHDSPEKIQDKIKRFGLEGRAIYKGWLTKDNMEEVFNNTIVNVLPSYNEGLPMTILESMGYGIPNISTNIAAIPEAISDGINGSLIEPGNIELLSAHMREYIFNIEMKKARSCAAYNTAKMEFSLEKHMEKLLGLYKNLL